VIGRLDDGGRRFIATAADGATLALLESDQPFGARVRARSAGTGDSLRNTVSAGPARGGVS
jgi:hypothetical protein